MAIQGLLRVELCLETSRYIHYEPQDGFVFVRAGHYYGMHVNPMCCEVFVI